MTEEKSMAGMSGSGWSRLGPGSDDQLRLMTKVARLYHEQGLRQAEIASDLHISQPRVSRLLKRASDLGVVRTTVTLPAGVYTDLEEALQKRYGLSEVVVVDTMGLQDVVPSLGAAAATYLEATLTGGDTIGISSWSETLLAAVDSLRPFKSQVADRIIQVVGGLGNPKVQVSATRLISRLASSTGADPVFLPAPAVVGGNAARETLLEDSVVSSITDQWADLTVLLAGIGSVEPSPLLRESGNVISDGDRAELRKYSAVGDICLSFFDEMGGQIEAPLSSRVIAIGAQLLREVPRRIAVAGGERKYNALLGLVRGGWATVLVTDLDTARKLHDQKD